MSDTDRSEEGLTRRDALRTVGLGGAAVGAGFLGGSLNNLPPAAADDSTGFIYGSDATGPGYTGAFDPPDYLDPDALDPITIAPVGRRGSQTINLAVLEARRDVAAGQPMHQWTFDGMAPGPIIRATDGDLLSITVTNRTDHNHNLHFHGRHSPLMDGWEPIPPGGQFTYEIEAGPAGLHPYHCHTMPLAKHVAKVLYGTMIVDPEPGRPPAHEFVLMLSGWDINDDGRNEIYTWNGVAGFFAKYPIKVPVGELIRVYVLNMTEYDPIGSFHLHAETFDVFPTGTGLTPSSHTDTVVLGQGERAIVEFTLPELGRYMFHPHQHHMAEAGAMGWFAAI